MDWFKFENGGRLLLAAAGGVLWASSFPKLGVAGFAWVAPGFILMSGLGASGRDAFRAGYLAGCAHYLISLYWILLVPFPAGAVLGWLALAAYLALYPATWVWLCWRLFPRTEGLPAAGRAGAWQGFLSTPLWRRAVWAFGCAAVWTGLEMAVARLFTGFPWNLLGTSQYEMLPLAQVASVAGVYGVSFLVAWFSVALACSGASLLGRPTASRAWLGDLFFPFLCVTAAWAFGFQQLRLREAPGGLEGARTVKAALIQPSIPQTLIWDPAESSNRFQQLITLSEQALTPETELLVWPEAAVPNLLRFDQGIYEAASALAAKHGVWLILGADDALPRPGSAAGREYDYYNSSFLMDPSGEIKGVYRKRQLVIFGEYIPFVKWLPFLKHLIPAGDGFAAGTAPAPFEIPELGLRTSVLICFEDNFPHLARHYAAPDTDFLLNLTNNGWFGESAAQWQHAANAVFRAIENGLPLVRCSNNGLTCWVDAAGRMRDVYFPDSDDVYRAGYKRVEIPLLREGETRSPTFYRRHGDLWGWFCVGLTGLLALRPRFKNIPAFPQGS